MQNFKVDLQNRIMYPHMKLETDPVKNNDTQMTLKIKAKVKNKVAIENFTYDLPYPLHTFIKPRLNI